MQTVTVEIAGKEYELRYLLADKRKIEEQIRKPLWEGMWSGISDDLNHILALGIWPRNRKHDAAWVEDELQKHIDNGGDVALVHKVVNRAILDHHILGKTDPAQVERIFRRYFEGVEEGPKEEPTVVRAQE
jgi:hypothetical protein